MKYLLAALLLTGFQFFDLTAHAAEAAATQAGLCWELSYTDNGYLNREEILNVCKTMRANLSVMNTKSLNFNSSGCYESISIDNKRAICLKTTVSISQ